MAERVQLMGLDFGTTTSSAVVALASLHRSAAGRMELSVSEEVFRSELVFTPLMSDDRVDLDQIEHLLDTWLAAGQVEPGRLFGGGALLTGLTAQKTNAAGLVSLIRRRLGQSLIATADDPCLESWLSFMGNFAVLSRQHPDKMILNLDIGGGTTNLALGQDRQVLRTGCLLLGARHVQVIPGSYRITKVSPYAQDIFEYLRIGKGPGDALTEAEVDAFVTFCISLLECVCRGSDELFRSPSIKHLAQVPFRLPIEVRDPVYTFSGGVGELAYRYGQGEPWPPTTYFGDLGIDLAQRVVASPIWQPSLEQFGQRPAGGQQSMDCCNTPRKFPAAPSFCGSQDSCPLPISPSLAGCIRMIAMIGSAMCSRWCVAAAAVAACR